MDRETDSWHGGLGRVAVAAVLVVAVLALAPGTTAAQSTANDASNATFIVQQGSQCTQVTPLGDGTESVEEFYNYEVLNGTANYSSLGTVDIQEDQTSQVFVYDGSDGLSLVFLHDEINQPGGFVADADISGLPADGDWVVEDDNYTNRDDVFEYTDTGAHIEWNSNGGRTDGAAFAGLDSPNYTTVDIDIAFNDETDRYPFEEWTGQPSDNEIETWQVRSGDGTTTELDTNQSIQLSPGTCDGGVSTFTPTPTPATSATGTTGAADTSAATSAPTAAATQTAMPTATRTTMSTATATATQTTTATSAAPQAAGTPAGTSAATGTPAGNGSGGGSDDGGESGAFGPGFGVVVTALAVVLLGIGRARRRRR